MLCLPAFVSSHRRVNVHPTTSLTRLTFLVLLSLFSGGCSFIYNLDADQCKVDSDCRALGGKFAKLVCERGVCVQPDDPSPEPGDGGGGCTSNAQCIAENLDRPFICRDGECIDITSDACPVVLQPENLKVPEPIIVGAYSAIDPTNKLGSPITLTYDLALREFTEEVGGLPGGPNNTRRRFVAVVCEGERLDSFPIEQSMDHLVHTVRANAVVAGLFTDALRDAFDAYARQDNIFFMSPLTADSSLTSEDNDGLLWFMLGAYADMAPAYVALTQRAEQFQRSLGDLSEPTRVALVQGSLAPARDIGQVLLSDAKRSLVFNGLPALENDDENFLFLQLTSDFEDNQARHKAVIEALQTFKPHVIVVTAGTEFTRKVLPVLESNWDSDPETGQIPPFYVLGPLLAFDPALADASNANVRKRLAGINFAAAKDRKLVNMLKANYEATYVDHPFQETENFYDAMYFTLYAIAASGNPARLTGDTVAQGMLRLVSKSGTAMSVGPSQVSDVLAALAVGSRVNLTGTLGPSDFDVGTGSRVAEGSVWCVNGSGRFIYDTLRLDEEGGELEGTFPCFSGLQP